MWALVLGRGGFEPPKALGQLIYSQSRLTASVSARPRDFTDNRAMSKLRWILWQGLIAPSMERFTAGSSNPGFEFSGLILQAHEEAPYVARYRIERRKWPLDARWSTSAGAGRLHRRRPRVAAVDQYAPNPVAGAGAGRDEIRRRSLGAQMRNPDMLHY